MQTSMSEVTDAVQSAADTFHTRGFCVVEDIVPTEDIKEVIFVDNPFCIEASPYCLFFY